MKDIKLLPFDEYLAEQLKDPEFKKHWDEQQEEYLMIKSILDARIRKNMTQKELSKKCGIDQGNLSKIETGEYNPTLKLLRRIAKALDTRLEIRFVPIETGTSSND